MLFPKQFNCVIGSDNYDRVNNDDPGVDWDEQGAADYDILDNRLFAATGGVVKYLKTYAGSQRGVIVLSRTTSGADRAQIRLGVTAGGDYVYGEVFIDTDNCAYLKVGQSTGGSLTDWWGNPVPNQPIYGYNVDVDVTLEVCWFPPEYPDFVGLVRARILIGGVVYGTQGQTDGDYGDGAALDADTGMEFDNWSFEMTSQDDANCPDCGMPPNQCVIGQDNLADGEDVCKWDGNKFKPYDPELNNSHCVSASFNIAAGESATIRINSNGAGTHAFATLQRTDAGGVATFTLSGGGSGIEDQASVTVNNPAAEIAASLCVCSYQGKVIACASIAATTVGGNLSIEALAYSETGGVESGYFAGKAGTVDWQMFTFYRMKLPECPPCNCGFTFTDNCCDTQVALKMPTYFIVRLTGLEDGWMPCSSVDPPIFDPDQRDILRDPGKIPCAFRNGNYLVKMHDTADPPPGEISGGTISWSGTQSERFGDCPQSCDNYWYNIDNEPDKEWCDTPPPLLAKVIGAIECCGIPDMQMNICYGPLTPSDDVAGCDDLHEPPAGLTWNDVAFFFDTDPDDLAEYWKCGGFCDPPNNAREQYLVRIGTGARGVPGGLAPGLEMWTLVDHPIASDPENLHPEDFIDLPLMVGLMTSKFAVNKSQFQGYGAAPGWVATAWAGCYGRPIAFVTAVPA